MARQHTNFARKRSSTAADGFSLIEFAAVITISALIFAAFLNLYSSYSKRLKFEQTYDRLYTANLLMTEAWSLDRRYFCPADPTLRPGDENYGRENCAVGVLPGSCTGGTEGVCKGLGIANNLPNQEVLIGMYPFVTVAEQYGSEEAEFRNRRNAVRTAYEQAIDPTLKASLKRTLDAMKKIRLSRASDLAFDGWRNQFTYAVTLMHTRRNNTEENRRIEGAIEMVNAALNEDTRRGIHFAIVSHGENGKAAYTRNGARTVACNDPSVSPIEQENCDLDGRFLRPALISTAKTADEADDFVVYNSYIAQELWRIVPCNTDGDPLTQDFCIYNTNPGNIGIGIADDDITEKLTIEGQMRAERIVTRELCDANGENCFSTDYIGGDAFQPCDQSGLAANQRRVAVQISRHAIRCDVITMPGYGTPCPPGHLAVGFTSSGLDCRNVCNPETRTNSTPCPSGQTGQINYAITLDCSNNPPSWGEWTETGRTCAAGP